MKKHLKVLAVNMLMMSVFVTVGCGKEDDPNNGGGNGVNGTFNGHDYVDLGLPSGTFWATCNVGAITPEGYGGYFAWGETQPKTTYNWSTYKWCNGNYDQLTKYCNDSYYGYNDFTDNLTVLLPEDDAATANWGSGWCMPTTEQWIELYQNTTSNRTTQNGVTGRLFISPNFYSLFLPAAGNRLVDELDNVGYGIYWSSSLLTDDSSYAWGFLFGKSGCYMNYGYRHLNRCNGYSVRPVRSASQN